MVSSLLEDDDDDDIAVVVVVAEVVVRSSKAMPPLELPNGLSKNRPKYDRRIKKGVRGTTVSSSSPGPTM